MVTKNSDMHLQWMQEHFDVTIAVEPERRASAIRDEGSRFRCVLTNSSEGFTADEISALPNLELICVQGIGCDNVDVVAAHRRGVVVTNGAGSNAVTVADHAFALLFAILRRIPMLDVFARQGGWRSQISPLPSISGRRLGICGMGAVGQCIARRAVAFDMPVGYFSRSPKQGIAAQYFPDIRELAGWADALAIALPGGASTYHLINLDVLRALGSDGYLVNVGRGSVVDSEALAATLTSGEIAGAGLDVYEGEPQFPSFFPLCPNLIVTPHVGGWSQSALDNSVRRFIDNAQRHFAGLPLNGVI